MPAFITFNTNLEGSSPSVFWLCITAGSAAGGAALALVSYFYRSQNLTKESKVASSPPPHYNTWIPFLGAAIQIGKLGGMDVFIRKASEELGNCPLFTTTLLGDHTCFIANPEDMNMIYKAKYQKDYLDDLSLQKEFTSNVLGMTESQIQQVFSSQVYKVASQQYHQYLFKGPELKTSMQEVQKFFHRWLRDLPSSQETTCGLYEFIGNAIFKASTGPLLSQACPQNETLYQDFRNFDQGVIGLFNRVPHFLMKNSVRARRALVLFTLSAEFWNQASPLMQARRAKLLEIMSPEALSKANLGVLWAANGNSIPAVFWMILRLLQDPIAYDSCYQQVQSIVAAKGNEHNTHDQLPLFTLEEMDQMTFLESAFLESLRMYQSNATARRVIKDFEFEASNGQKFHIRKGTKLMVFWKVLHSDPEIWKDPQTFRFDRFVNPTKYTYSSGGTCLPNPPIVPFGGGSHLCPGRKFIGYESRLLAALLMLHIDMKLCDTKIPDVEATQQGIGVSQPIFDPAVRVRRRC